MSSDQLTQQLVQETKAFRGRVMVADDDELFREGLIGQLRYAGFDCIGFACAQTALEALKQVEVDFLIADIHMPGNVNLELIAPAYELVPGLPILILTGRPSVETAARSVRLPVFAYMVKPPEKAELLQAVEEGVSRYTQLRRIRSSRNRMKKLEEELGSLEAEYTRVDREDDSRISNEFLRLTMRNLAFSMAELDKALEGGGRRSGSGSVRMSKELMDALRHSVDVLEQTKRSFKSKELGKLRQHLEVILQEAKDAQ